MSNDFFTAAAVPSTGASLASATIRNEFAAIEDGFDKLPTMTGNGSELVAVNSSGTALEAIATTGTGSGVRATSPTLVTPTIGVATATSINKVAVTAPATSATLTIADGKTLTANNTITLTATDGSTLAIGTGGTLGAAAFLAGAGTTYTPTLTTTANCSGASVNSAIYIRLGSAVALVVSVSLTVTTGAGTSSALDFTIPVASNFGSTSDGLGISLNNAARDVGNIVADVPNDRLQANWEASASGATTMILIAIYRVI